MQIQFKLLKKQIRNVQEAFRIRRCFLEKEWKQGLERLIQISFPEHSSLCDDADVEISQLLEFFLTQNPIHFDEMEQFHYKNYATVLSLQKKWNDVSDTEFVMDLTQDEIGELENTLDFVTRMACGQWDRWAETLYWFTDENDISLYPYLVCSDRQIDFYRNKIFPYYEKKRLVPGASFGIHSKDITEEIRSLYDIYKVLMYENNQGGVYAYYPREIAHGYPKPLIQFPYRSHFLYTGDNEALKDWVVTLENCQQKVLDWGQDKKPLFDEGDWWFPLGDGKLQKPKEKETIYQTYNGYFVFKEE